MTEYFQQALSDLGPVLLNILGALALLIVGYIVAKFVSRMIRKVLRQTTLDDRVGKFLSSDDSGGGMSLETAISKGVFWLIMLFVFMGVLQILNLTLVTEPFNAFLNSIFTYLPKLIGAAVLGLVAFIVASALRMLSKKGLESTNIDSKMAGDGVEDEAASGQMPLSQSISTAVYYLVFLLFLPAILGVLGMQGILEPVQDLVNEMMGFLPNIFGAVVIALVGYFVAKLVRQIVSNLLSAAGADRLAERVGIATVMGEQTLSAVIGTVVYILVLLPVLVSALNVLSIDAVTGPASQMLDMIMSAIPKLFAAVIIIGIAYVIGKVVGGLVTNLLAGIGFNNVLGKIGFAKGQQLTAADDAKSPAGLVGTVVMVAILVFSIMEAASVLGFDAMSDIMVEILALGGQILLGLMIFALGMWLANLVHDAVQTSGMNQAKIVANVGRISILVLAGAMALRQMGLANSIINMAFGLVLGAVAVAAAIAFGIGGREFAKQKIEEFASTQKGGGRPN